MDLKSKVGVARPGSPSLRTSIPQGIVVFLDLKEGDTLEWKMVNTEKGERFTTVHKKKVK